MTVTISGDTGISAVQAGAVESGDLPAGSVIQVVSTTQTERVLVSGSGTNSIGWNDITGLVLNITPTSASSKILLQAYVVVSGEDEAMFRFYKNNSTPVAIGTNTGNRTPATAISTTDWQNGSATTSFGNLMAISHTMVHLDSPNTTNEITYSVQAGSRSTTKINRFYSDVNNYEWGSSISSFTLMEIAG